MELSFVLFFVLFHNNVLYVFVFVPRDIKQ